MTFDKRECLEDFFEKRWYQEFTRLRDQHDKKAVVDDKNQVNADGDDLGKFLRDSEDTASQCELEVLNLFCREIGLKDVKEGGPVAGFQKNAWLDERASTPDLTDSGDARPNENPLTATGLFRALAKLRYGHEKLPDAARRLIYILDLSPSCVYALAATASWHQAPALRDAIYNHLAFQNSIAVKIPSAGFLTFQLDLHIPYLILSKSTRPEQPTGKANIKPQRRWTDLSFLKLDTEVPSAQEQGMGEVWSIQDAHFSCVVTGTDEWRWTGYGFADAESDGFLTDLSKDDLSFDQIAAKGIDAKKPICSPRDYWIKVFEIRIELVRKAWDYLIFKLEDAIRRYIDKHPFTSPRHLAIELERAAEMKEAFAVTLETMGLLRRLHGVLSGTIQAWTSFKAPGGDIDYFRSIDAAPICPNAKRSFVSINNSFQKLQKNEAKLVLLQKSCFDYARTLELYLNLEAKETADHNEITSEFIVSVLYPFALAAAIFSMQTEAIPFNLTPRSFAITCLVLIIVVYASRLAGRHFRRLLQLLKRMACSWIKREKIRDVGNNPSRIELQGGIPPAIQEHFERLKVDEESHGLAACQTTGVVDDSVEGLTM
ncbi:hypothetical protein DL98DRAFT_149862 [Cadophora sp. DSE1049]|nr:hypothetical protein DL98DRAFT_149862 [Cadophora sp. DSE1049]